MGAAQLASRWISVEEYSLDGGATPSELVSMILDGQLSGERRGDRWYLAPPLVMLETSDSGDAMAILKISACRIGAYVTAGRGELGIPLWFGDPGRPAALVAIDDAMTKVPDLPVEIRLNGERFLVDSSLWVDLGAALVTFATLDPTGGEAS